MDKKRNRDSYLGYSCGKNWTHDLPFGSDFVTTCRHIYWAVHNSEGGLAGGQTRCLTTARTLKEAKTFLAYWLWFKLGVVNGLCLSALPYVWGVDPVGYLTVSGIYTCRKKRIQSSVRLPSGGYDFSRCFCWRSVVLSTVSWISGVRFVLERNSACVNPLLRRYITPVESDRSVTALRKEPVLFAVLRHFRRRC